MFRMTVFYQVGLLQIFTALSFYFLDIIFWVQKFFFIFNGVQFINYFLHGLWLWCCVFDIPKIFSSMLFSRSFILLYFPLFLVFCSFKVVYLGVFYIYPSCCSLTLIDLWLCVWLNLEKFPVIIVTKFLLFLSLCLLFLYFYFAYLTSFVVVPQSLDIPLYSFQSLFPLLFGFGNFYWYIPKLRESFLSHDQSTNKPWKTFFIPVTVFLISSIYFWFFLRIFISFLTSPIHSCMISPLSLRTLSILITVALNSWYDHSNNSG